MNRAVIVTPDPSTAAGGVERMCAVIARVLEDLGWQVELVGPARDANKWEFRLGLSYLIKSSSATRAARAARPDLLITNGFLGTGSSREIPRIHVFHGTMVSDTRAEASALSVRERVRRIIGAGAAEALGGRGATVVSVSDSTAEEVRRFYRIRTNVVIPNGVDTNVFAPRDRAACRAQLGLPASGRLALYVGRIQQRKGTDLLMSATQRSGFQLMIAGSEGLPGAHHLGILDPDGLARAYAAADCVLFPTRYEGFGLVAIESLACARPVLMPKVGWMPTLLASVPEYESACITPTVDDIADRLSSLESDNLQGVVARARQFVLENNSLERYAEHWRELIENLGFQSTTPGARPMH